MDIWYDCMSDLLCVYMYHALVMNESDVNTVKTGLLFLYLITINQQVQLLQMSLQIHCMSVHNSQLL